MWMIRGEGGRLYDDFREKGVAAIGWAELAAYAKKGVSRKELAQKFSEVAPHLKPGQVISGASQVWRFINEIEIGDWAVTYSPYNRTYLMGRITGDFQYREEWIDADMPMARAVSWEAKEIGRDSLSSPARTAWVPL